MCVCVCVCVCVGGGGDGGRGGGWVMDISWHAIIIVRKSGSVSSRKLEMQALR